MAYSQINKTHIDFFITKLGEKNVLFDDLCVQYGSDHTENLNFPPLPPGNLHKSAVSSVQVSKTFVDSILEIIFLL